MSKYHILLVQVDELWLKGKNRSHYIRTLKGHINHYLKKSFDGAWITRNENQRFVIETEDFFGEDVIQGLARIPGIFSVVPAIRVEQDLDMAASAAINELGGLLKFPSTFKVNTQRSDKRFPMTSMEASRNLGGMILKAYDGRIKVDVHHPEVMVELKISASGMYVSLRKIFGVGGLPVGTSGHLVTMLSGGFDSPVASFLMAKRGCRQDFVFFHAYPFVGDEVKEKIVDLVTVLARYQNGCRLFVVPFGDIQNLIAQQCREEYRTIFFRKYMVVAANILANKLGAEALLTGDSLGQVSSQTIGNIALIDVASERPVFRPLLGHNKREVIQIAKEVGTHDISIRPHDDACGLFAPKHPIIKPDQVYCQRFDQENDFTPQLKEAVEKAEIIRFDLTGQIIL